MTTATRTKKSPAKTASPVHLPELIDMLEAGVHFGHERSKKNPKMDSYIYILRNRMAIIDLEKTQSHLATAANYLFNLAKDPAKQILFVGTKRQTRPIIKHYAEAAGMPYVTQRWIGGTLTNFKTVLKSIEKLEELKKLQKDPAWDKLTKKERSVHGKEMERLARVLEGVKDIKKLPAALIVCGSYDEKIAVKEAARVGIPIVGITDTNANPTQVTYPIPANDDAIRSIDLIINTLTQAIMSARHKKAKTTAYKIPVSNAVINDPVAAKAEPAEEPAP